MINSYSFLRPWLFCLDPERAHNLTLSNMDRAYRWGLLERFVTQPAPDPRTICGITFPNPVGLAAGLDKDGKHIDVNLKLTDQLVKDFFMSVHKPDHDEIDGTRICNNQPERSKREDIEHCTSDSDCRKYGCQ